jgi:peptide/nickel transport system substrate-binding protein
MLLTSCSTPTPEPVTIIETVIVEREGQTIVETVIVTQEVERQVVVTPTAVPQAEQVLNVAFTTGPGGGQPELGRPWIGGAGHTTHTKLYIAPTIFNRDLSEVIPYAVESWEYNDDFTVWTYKLREDLLWSDGEPLTTEDWKFTAEFITDPEFVTDNIMHRAHAFDQVVGYKEKINGEAEELEGVQVINDYTIEYTLTVPNPRHHVQLYRTYFLPKHAIDFEPSEFLTTNWWVDPDKQVGSGPFTIAEFVMDSYAVLEKNPLYFEGEPKLDRIIDHMYGGNITSAVLALQAGQIDFTYVEPTDLATLGDGYNVFSNNSNVVVYLDIHYRDDNVPDFWDDIRVRQAILHAIDRNAITEQVLDGTHYPIPCPVSYPELWHEDVDWFEYDPEKARSLLAEAGVNPSDIVFEWVTHAGYNNIHHNSALQAVQAYLADIGVNMTYRFVDVATFRERYTADGEWTFHYRGATMPYYGAEWPSKWTNAGSQGGDFKGYDMVETGLEEAIQKIDQAPTIEEYFQATRDFCLLHNQLVPDLQLWIGNRYGVADTKVQNFWWQPAGGGGPYKDDSHLWYIEE